MRAGHRARVVTLRSRRLFMACSIHKIAFVVALAVAGSASGGAFAEDSMSKTGDAMHSDSMAKSSDSMKKDTMGSDAMHKDSMGKDATMKKDSMGSDSMAKSHDTMAPEKK